MEYSTFAFNVQGGDEMELSVEYRAKLNPNPKILKEKFSQCFYSTIVIADDWKNKTFHS